MRRHWFSTACGTCFVAVGTMLTVTRAVPSAQRRTADNASEGLPVATNAILQNPDAYYGKRVTVSAGLEARLSPTAFVIDQRKVVGGHEVKAIGKPLLVIAPYLTGPLDQKTYLLMRGEVVKFDAAALARAAPDYTLDLAPEIAARYQGQPVLVAASVVDAPLMERAKRPLPPPSADEVALSAAMKAIGPAFTALRTAAEASKAEVITENAATLQPGFIQTETIWDGLGQSAAAQWARDAGTHLASIQRAAAAGNWEAVKTSTGALNQVCQNCHGAYREREEDGSFRIKPGSF